MQIRVTVDSAAAVLTVPDGETGASLTFETAA